MRARRMSVGMVDSFTNANGHHKGARHEITTGGATATVSSLDQAGGGPNTSTALRPPNANEFDIV